LVVKGTVRKQIEQEQDGEYVYQSRKVPAKEAWVSHGRLTVKLRGRAQAPDSSRGRTISPRDRGDPTAHHGTLQRLLEAMLGTESPTVISVETQRCKFEAMVNRRCRSSSLLGLRHLDNVLG